MNFIIDENVSLGLADRLRNSGHNVISIAEEPNRGFEDEDIFTLCKKTKSILITRDYHFTNPIRFPAKGTKGIIYIRHGNLSSQEEIELVEQILNTHPIDLFSEKLVLLSRHGLKIR